MLTNFCAIVNTKNKQSLHKNQLVCHPEQKPKDLDNSVVLLSAMVGRLVVVGAMLLFGGGVLFFLSCPFSVLLVLMFLGLLHSLVSFVRLFFRPNLHHSWSLCGSELDERREKDTYTLTRHTNILGCTVWGIQTRQLTYIITHNLPITH